jgi:ATP-binding cassette subfamily D (ALD) long-chain fatty acid import protein
LIKYVWSAFGLGMCAIPVFLPEWAGAVAPIKDGDSPESGRTKGFITNKRYSCDKWEGSWRKMYYTHSSFS